jgi:hypothetical protein
MLGIKKILAMHHQYVLIALLLSVTLANSYSLAPALKYWQSQLQITASHTRKLANTLQVKCISGQQNTGVISARQRLAVHKHANSLGLKCSIDLNDKFDSSTILNVDQEKPKGNRKS